MEDDLVPNPFRVRYHPQPQTRNVPLAIDLVLVGDKPADCSAIINGRLYSPGDTLEGMSIAVIGAETVELRQRNLIVGEYSEAPTREEIVRFLGALPGYRVKLAGYTLDPDEEKETLRKLLSRMQVGGSALEDAAVANSSGC